MSSRWMLVVLAWLLIPMAASAQQADLLMGQVKNESGQPLPGARVEVQQVSTELTRSTITNKDGRYTIYFPDGDGLYVLKVTFIGMADVVQPVIRETTEDILMSNLTMYEEAINLEEILVAVQGTGAAGVAGADLSTTLSQDILARLPLPDMEPETVALMTAGVTGLGINDETGRMQFSVGGM